MSIFALLVFWLMIINNIFKFCQTCFSQHFCTQRCLLQGAYPTQHSGRFHHWPIPNAKHENTKLKTEIKWKKLRPKNEGHNHLFVNLIFFLMTFLISGLNPLHIGSNSYPFSRFRMPCRTIDSVGFNAFIYTASLIFLLLQFFSLSKYTQSSHSILCPLFPFMWE